MYIRVDDRKIEIPVMPEKPVKPKKPKEAKPNVPKKPRVPTKEAIAKTKRVRVRDKGMSNIISAYGLEKECADLYHQGKNTNQIVAILNERIKEICYGETPPRIVSIPTVNSFLSSLRRIGPQIVAENNKRLVAVVSSSIDLIDEVNDLFMRSKVLLAAMEAKAAGEDKYVNPYQYKAVASEMREMLKQMIDIQREINDYANVKKFMEIILTTLKEEVPTMLPVIIKRLKDIKDTQWFSEFLRR